MLVDRQTAISRIKDDNRILLVAAVAEAVRPYFVRHLPSDKPLYDRVLSTCWKQGLSPKKLLKTLRKRIIFSIPDAEESDVGEAVYAGEVLIYALDTLLKPSVVNVAAAIKAATDVIYAVEMEKFSSSDGVVTGEIVRQKSEMVVNSRRFKGCQSAIDDLIFMLMRGAFSKDDFCSTKEVSALNRAFDDPRKPI